ncbi:ergothioneine biosynthesis protein EgtB [Psychroserpens mesophilus]|uniref:ergothioneine biosynthesis protein EgtB n=1 Tax=Psychroserpens mesophilus TaxID=325473 RepID=UPI003D648704
MNTDPLIKKFKTIRQITETICEPLEIEDFSVQPIVDVSPPKWHLAHSTWFFEQFVLTKFKTNYTVFDEDFAYLFNSYYNNAGERVLRPNRGLMTRPTVKKVFAYRKFITQNIIDLLKENHSKELIELIEIGINHEQQHQELLVYDIKYILGHQPTFPTYETDLQLSEVTQSQDFISVKEGIYTIGFKGDGFCFDNELGLHKVYIHPFQISNRLVTNKDYIEFINAGGYQNFNLWHAEGWDFINNNNITAPLYWHFSNGKWQHYSFNGLEDLNPNEPVMHMSYYEAFAFAEWKGMRLPTEFEWEVASSKLNWGNLWEWTASAYEPYPNYTKAEGALGEYNGKFMVGLQVLRGASVATSKNHSRNTYRNFFHPSLQWMFSGIRLVK